MRRFPIIIALGSALLLSSSCASTYNLKARAAHYAYHQGRFEDAAALIEEVKPARRDRLLFLLDKGMILHAAGKYHQSNIVLTGAEELSDALTAKSISREAAAALWSEEATEYAGEVHERMMIPVIRMLNYIMLDEWNEALVEVRRLITLTEKIYGNQKEIKNAFSIYLSGIIWEALGHINDALIAYGRLTEQGKDVPYFGYDISTIGKILGLSRALPPEQSLAWTTSKNYRKNTGELIVVVEAGRSPIFKSETAATGFITMDMPVVVTFRQHFESAKVIIDGADAGQTYPFYNILDDILIALKDRQRRSFIRKMIKIPVETGLYAASVELLSQDDTESKLAGIGLGLLAMSMTVAEKTEERSWRTLPAQFCLGRFYLPPGTHTVEIVPKRFGAPISRTIDVMVGKPAVWLMQYPQSDLAAEAVSGTVEEKLALEAKSRQERLKEMISADPKNGDLKIDLAYALMEAGDYDADNWLTKGMNQGGDIKRAIQGYIIIYVVTQKYEKARYWIERGMRQGLKSTLRLSYYIDALNYLEGLKARPAGAALTDEKNIFNALNYYVAGLVAEHDKDYEKAAENFMLAYKHGLTGETVAKKVVSNFKSTGDDFKKSKLGMDIAIQFADLYLTGNPK